MISVYPESRPAGRRLPLPAGQTLAYRRLGDPRARAWLALHGGPGSGAQAGLWQAFDLRTQQVLAPDQRGSGRSTPRGSLRGQSLGAMIDDLERLRRALGLESWPVMGGSWGATLALLYAARHPDAVEALVLRGSFKGTRREVNRLFRRFWPRAAPPVSIGQDALAGVSLRHLRPNQTGKVLQSLSQLFRNGTMSLHARRIALAWQAMEQAAALHGARRAWLHAEQPEARRLLRQSWQSMRPARLRRQLERPEWMPTRNLKGLWQKYRIQSHHLAHRCGLAPADWHDALQTVAAHGIATTWIHGRFDAVCPASNSLASHRALSAGPDGHSRLVLTEAGHLGTEPCNREAIRVAIGAAVSGG